MRTRRNSRKGFELSVGFIVILIITIVIFTSSIVVIRKFFVSTTEIETGLSTEAQGQIESLLSAGQSVALVPQLYETSTGKSNVGGIGIVNTLKEKRKFYIIITFSKAFDSEDKQIIDVDPEKVESWLLFNPGPYELEQAERIPAKLLVKPGFQITDGTPTKPGTYIYNVCILQAIPSLYASTINNVLNARRTDCSSKAATQIGNTLYNAQKYKLQVKID
jgi:hypothetical protein